MPPTVKGPRKPRRGGDRPDWAIQPPWSVALEGLAQQLRGVHLDNRRLAVLNAMERLGIVAPGISAGDIAALIAASGHRATGPKSGRASLKMRAASVQTHSEDAPSDRGRF